MGATDRDEPLGSPTLSRVGRQQLEHAGIGCALFSGERVCDGMRQVQVAHDDRVGIAEGNPGHVGGRPGADPRDHLEAASRRKRVEPDHLLQTTRLRRGATNRFGSLSLDAERVKSVVAERGQPLGGRRGDQPEGTGGGFAVAPNQAAVTAPGLHTGHLLTNDHRQERLEDRQRSTDPHSGESEVQFSNPLVGGAEGGGIVVQTEEIGGRIEGPAGSGPPRLHLYLLPVSYEQRRRKAGRRASGAQNPGRADAHARIAGAVPQGSKGQAQIEGAVGMKSASPH